MNHISLQINKTKRQKPCYTVLTDATQGQRDKGVKFVAAEKSLQGLSLSIPQANFRYRHWGPLDAAVGQVYGGGDHQV